ncbi:MAG TPA: hypothetical protein VLA78_00445 [Paracoccaceae bacterium]|nr:hypothetical protein [Paracoccaceae bacterium]
MMLIDETGLPDAVLPVQALKDHLRMGTGFADDDLADGLMAAHLRAAVLTIEGRTGKVLPARRFRWTFADWRDGQEQALPVAPVTALVAVNLIPVGGPPVPVDPARYGLVPDGMRPRIRSVGLLLPHPAPGGRVEVTFDAGFGPGWAAVPGDLSQAVVMLAAAFWDHRSEAGRGDPGLPMPVAALIERWRTVRVLGGGAA